ncbi:MULTISPECIES: extracellular electron transfer flavoprotein PplA [unclassified Enterococcus]|uniref:extracellular electron transfer flavoprotein PplA n=1 Tax=unclassified Enterococcus TaxID=2608891 RepID=UPI0006B96AD0|nr:MULTISPECIES: extracellular electron transfer flavoprotein PplA [unclassified Enterococcus]KPG72014.1 FMN-binding protein [Enterococcus sp. RIT-PI-f]
MKAKKLIVGMAVFSFAALLLGGCGSDNNSADSSSTNETTSQSSTVASSTATSESEATVVAGAPMQDGTYKLEEKNYKNDYRVSFEITVVDGKITESKYDNINADGESKTENTEYNETMKEKAGISPEEFIPKFNEELVAAQSPSSIEVVSGATHSFDSFQNYAQQLIQAAQAGNTETIEIDNGADLQDGTYTLEEKNYSNGYRVAFSITVADGKVSESNYDYVNEAGESKKDDADYNENMKAKSGTNPEEFIPNFNEEFVTAVNAEDGSVADMDVVSGATHSFHSFVIYAQQLLNAAEKGDQTPIEVDNFVTE